MPFIDGFCGFFRGEMVQFGPIWGHKRQKHRFYGIKRWNMMRKKKLFLHPPIPPWSRWSPLSGNICGCQNKSIYFFHFWSTFWIKKWELLWPLLGGGQYEESQVEQNYEHKFVQFFRVAHNGTTTAPINTTQSTTTRSIRCCVVSVRWRMAQSPVRCPTFELWFCKITSANTVVNDNIIKIQ